MEIKVLAFAASPRRHGNSETLLDWVIAAMEERDGVVVEKVVLSEADVRPCRGCNACERLNRCVQDDGMTALYDRILEADVVVLALPVYCMGACAQAKALLDRVQVFRSRKYVLHLPVVPAERVGKRDLAPTARSCCSDPPEDQRIAQVIGMHGARHARGVHVPEQHIKGRQFLAK